MESQGIHEQLHASGLGVRVLNRGRAFLAVALFAAAFLVGRGGYFPAALAVAQTLAADYGGLPDDLGRDAVYFNCTACHSLKQFTQQRLPREEWDALLDWMVEKNGMHPMEPWARTLVLNYLTTHYGLEEDGWQGLPAAPGRELVFGICQACHSLAIVKQQGLDRDSWDETLEWMVEEQGMPPLDAENRDLVLDYLATYYGRE